MPKLTPFIFFFFLFSSCQRALYISNKINTAGFTEAHETKADIAVRPQNGKEPLCYSVTAAYAPISHLVITGAYHRLNYMNSKEQIYNDSNVNDKKRFVTMVNGNYAEIGAGYFTKLKHDCKVELVGGLGNGSVKNNGGRPSSFTLDPRVFAFDSRYYKLFAQVGYGAGNDQMSIMFGARQSMVKYYSFASLNPSLKYTITAERTDITKEFAGLFEPYFEARAGWKQIKFILQCNTAIQVSGPELGSSVVAPYAGLGIAYNYAPRFKIKTKKSSSDSL